MAATRPDWRALGVISVVSLLAWGLILLTPEARFWDDWVLANDDTLRMTRELGLPWVGYLVVALFALGPWSFKVVAIACTIAIGWFAFLISGRGLGLVHGERLLLAALIVSLPLFAIRSLAAVAFYSWSLAAFMAGWYLLVGRDPGLPGRGRYLAGAALLFVSYSTASLLPFTLLPVAHLALLAFPRGKGFWAGCLVLLRRYWFVVAAPALFWVVRTIFFTPYGLYDKYNTVGVFDSSQRLLLISAGLFGLLLVFAAGVFLYWLRGTRPARAGIRDGISLGLLGLAALAAAAYFYVTRVSPAPSARVVPALIAACAVVIMVSAIRSLRDSTKPSPGRSDVTPLLAVGLATLALAVLPYLLVAKLPSYANWESRHQLLMPVGVAIIVVAAVRALRSMAGVRVVRATSAVIVGAMVVTSASITLALIGDWHKQEQVIAALQEQDLVKNASTVVFSDLAPQLNFDARPYTFYEFNGWMISAYGDQKRLGVQRSAVGDFLDGKGDGLDYAASRYGYAQYVKSSSGVLVEIVAVNGANWWTNVLGRPSILLEVTAVDDLDSLR